MEGCGAVTALRSTFLKDMLLSPEQQNYHHQINNNSGHQNQQQGVDVWSMERSTTLVAGDDFSIDDLLNLEELEDDEMLDEDEHGSNSNSSSGLFHDDTTEPLFIPTEDISDLEWVSHIVNESDDSFYGIPSSAISPAYLPLATNHSRSPSSGSITSFSTTLRRTFPSFSDEILVVPSKVRSARTGKRVWTSSELAEPMCSTTVSSCSSSTSSLSSCLMFDPKTINPHVVLATNHVPLPRGRGRPPLYKKETHLTGEHKDQNKQQKKKKGRKPKTTTATTSDELLADGSNGRRCSHCGVQKTPQWRAGPMGAKTLCNACGVRYKSGRLLPEYRPAISPTFLDHVHSNSHRKVLEMRRKKEFEQRQLLVTGDSTVSVVALLPAQHMVF